MEISLQKLDELLSHRDETDLQDGSHLDYKLELHLDTKNERRQFAKDVIGFANINGGYLVIGVEDENWNLIGIDPENFDSEKIERVGREMVRPKVRVTARLLQKGNKYFGVIYVPKTHELHSTLDYQVYARIGRSVEPVGPSFITGLKIENAVWMASQNKLGSMEKYHDQDVDLLLERFAENLTCPTIFGRLFQKKREEAFFALQAHQEGFELFKQSCSIRVHPNDSIDEEAMRLIMLRGYGLLAAAYLRSKNRGEPNQEPIIITMELEPSKMTPDGDYIFSKEEDIFFNWLEEFKGLHEEEHDRELFTLRNEFDKMSNDEFIQFMQKRFIWPHWGAARALKLTTLQIEQIKTQVKAMGNLDLMTWNVLVNFGLASVSDLFSLKLPYR